MLKKLILMISLAMVSHVQSDGWETTGKIFTLGITSFCMMVTCCAAFNKIPLCNEKVFDDNPLMQAACFVVAALYGFRLYSFLNNNISKQFKNFRLYNNNKN